MNRHLPARAAVLAATLALMAPTALAAMAPEGDRLAQMRRPSPSPSVRPTATPTPAPRPTVVPTPRSSPVPAPSATPVATPLPPGQEPIQRGTEPVEPMGATATHDGSPFDFSVGLEYELGSATSGGVSGDANGVPTQIPGGSAGINAWSVITEVGLGAFDVGARYTSYLAVSPLTVTNPAGGALPFFWPQEAWSAYGRLGALRLGYLNEFFGRGIGSDGAIGSVILGVDGGFPLLVNMLDVDWSLTGGWGVVGQGPGHIPAEAKLGLNMVLGPLNLTGGYVGRATFTGDPGTFFTAMTNPASLTTGSAATANQTRIGTYQGPFVGVSFGF